MIETVLFIGIIASIFVGVNIGGFSTELAWGPALSLIGIPISLEMATVMTIVGIGFPARNILGRAEEYDAIVMGSHCKSGTERFLLG